MKKGLKYTFLILLLFFGVLLFLYSCHTFNALDGIWYE